MKKIHLTIFFSICIIYVNAQSANNIKQKDYKPVLNSDIFRISITQPLAKDYETSAIFSFSYERKIIGAVTSVSKIGCGISVKNFSPRNNENGQYSFHAFGSEELRYYFNLMHRIKKEKSVTNYSSPYISLEQNIFSNAIGLVNQNSKDAVQGSTNTYINIGFQAQPSSKHIYIAAYLGVRCGGKSLSKFYDESISRIHGGLTIGYVF